MLIHRYLTGRMFSVAEIRQVLLSGRILEIHSHPLRCDGYLFLGCPAGRSIHIIKKVPAGLCVQCGEKYISAETSKKLVSKLEADAVDCLEEVRVFHYDEK